MISTLTVIGIVMMLLYALMGEPPESALTWLIVLVGVDILIAILGLGGKKSGRTEKVSITDAMLFDKGMTYSNGHEYERYVAYLLERRGYRDVRITPKTGDFGADIICMNSAGKRVAVQCKMYAKPVGYRAVEEALGAMHYYNCDEAMVVTNNTFTKQAQTAAKKVGVMLEGYVK